MSRTRGQSSIAELIDPDHRDRPKSARRKVIDREAERLQNTLDLYERLMEIAADEPDAARRRRIEELAWDKMREADPVRILHAKQLLQVSDRTIADWAQRGLLDARPGSPKRVSLDSVLRIKAVVDELREAGRDRDLVGAVMSRLERSELEDNKRFQDSLGQMRRGERGEWPEDF